jgi:hypothetical protein
MARFLPLSKTTINLEAIRLIHVGIVKPKEGESGYGCTVYFTNSPEPYAFYGDDARKIMDAIQKMPCESPPPTVAVHD